MTNETIRTITANANNLCFTTAHEIKEIQPVKIEKPVLLVGNFLSAVRGNYNVCEDLADRLEKIGVPVLTTSDKPAKIPRLFDIVATVWRKRHDYIVAHVDVYSGRGFALAETVCWALRKLGKPYAMTLRGGGLPDFSRRWPRRVRRLLRSAEVVATPSGFLFEQMAPYCAQLRLQLNPIDLNSYSFRTRHRPRPDLIWLRAFQSLYNPSLAAEVMAELAKDIPDVNLVMYGPDKGDGSLQAMRELATRLGVSQRITTPGALQKSEVPAKLNSGDIFLNTTNVDNTPISVLEAMACGLCIVSTNVGGIPYLLEHERDALLVPRADASAMAAAVRRLVTEPGLSETLSANARKKSEQFDWSRVMPQWEEMLTTLSQRT